MKGVIAPRWWAICVACRRRVLHRATAWSDTHRGRICAQCATPGPTEQTYEPAALLHEITSNGRTSQKRDNRAANPHNHEMEGDT